MLLFLRSFKQRYNKAVSLIEVLVAFVIFTAAVFPFVNILRYSGKANVKSVRAVQATNLALSQMEQMKYGSACVEYNIPGLPAPLKNVFNGFYALQWMIVEASGASNQWGEFTKTIPYGKIAGYPNYQMEVAVSFFPVKTFAKKQFPPLILDTKTPPPPVANPTEQPEYDRMMSRIQVSVIVKWIEPDTKKELDFKAFTIVTKP